MPLLILFLLILSSKKDVMQDQKSTQFVVIMSIITLLFSLFMSYQAYLGFMDLLSPQ